MDYVEWCDSICDHLANYGEAQSGFVYLSSFASDYLKVYQVPEKEQANQNVVMAVDAVFRVFRSHLNSPRLNLTDEDIEMLRATYERWQAVFQLNVSDTELAVLEALNRMSIIENNGTFSLESVRMSDMLTHPAIANSPTQLTEDRLIKLLKRLETRKLARPSIIIGDSTCTATYASAVTMTRDQVISDSEIDQLRVQGESETLDYKRQIKITSKTEKAEFARDVMAFANGSGEVKRFLVGVEDDGTFTVPPDPLAHALEINAMKETTLQQIVSERTVQAPSIRISARGVHRNGPYAVIEIKSNIGHLPYRFFANPGDSKQPGAAQAGEVVVRKGTTKQTASADEIFALENRAALYRRLNPGSV